MGEHGALADLAISSREREVLTLLGEHLTNQEIGSRLYISVRTVESHVSSLLCKLGVADRRALADLARTVPEDGSDDPTSPPQRLPSTLTSFVGRVAERTALAEALGESRLVTAVGPGGVGKTRLALAVTGDLAARFAHGAWYVDLVPVTDPMMVASAVATALGLGEHPRLTPAQMVTKRFVGREALLVLDNCEHVIDGVAPFVERLLTECTSLTVLTTSRARLVVPFERVYPVPGLAVADGEEEGDAVVLFRERAGLGDALTPDQQRQVVAICKALDGMALAIELAAARLPVLGIDGLESGLTDQLRLLAGGPRAEDRHQSLRATLDWSYALLDPLERAMLRRVSVFAGPFTADAAARVTESEVVGSGDVADSLARLAERSMLTVVTSATGTRYRMLETIRQYGEEQLVAEGEDGSVRAGHLDWCVAVARDCDRLCAAEDPGWRKVLDDAADELRAALGWATAVPEPPANAHQLARLLGELLFARGMPTEAQRRVEEAATFCQGPAKVETLALAADIAFCARNSRDMFRLRCEAAAAAEAVGDPSAAAYNLAQAIEAVQRFPGMFSGTIPQRRELDELRVRAGELAGDDPPATTALAIVDGGSALQGPNRELADERSARAVLLAQATGRPALESAALDQRTAFQLARGDIAAAHASCLRRIELLGAPPHGIPVAGEVNDETQMAALTSLATGDLARGHRFARMRPEMSFYSEESGMAAEWLIAWAALVGEFDEAVGTGSRFRVGWEQAGQPSLSGMSVAPYALAMVHGLRGDDVARAEWLDIHAEFRRASVAGGFAPSATAGTFYAEWFDAIVLLHDGDLEGAVAALAAEPESFDTWNTAAFRQWYAALWAESAALTGLPNTAERIARAGAIAAGNPVATAIVARADALLHTDPAGLADAATALLASGCRYQWARTLVLAGGELRTEGEAAMAAMGAKPMAVP